MTPKPIIEFKGISKTFPGVKALEDIRFDIREGEVHALIGENGAGKSTLLNILHGIYPEYEGEVWIEGKKVAFKNAQDAIKAGISKVHQEVSLIADLTVGQNVALGHEPKKGPFIDFKSLHARVDVILKRLRCNFKSTDLVSTLSTGEMQMLSIAKALFHESRIISFDEPTAALTENEVQALFEIIRQLKANGITVIFISHRLDELFTISDRITVLRDGKHVGTYPTSEMNRQKLIQSMVGRDVSAFAERKKTGLTKDEVVLEVRNLSRAGVFRDVQFHLKKGEILGFSGLVGSKRTDVVRAVFGADPITSGDIYVKGRKARIRSPKQGLKYGIGLIPENRKTQGFVRNLNNTDNMALAALKKFCFFGFVRSRKKIDNCRHNAQELQLHPDDPEYMTFNLSGGNQQKVVLGKWLSTDADILIFDEPTKGVDVGAKAEIYRLMEDLLEAGKSIIMVSSELPEVIGMSDRVMVMHEGRIVKELSREELSEETILHYAMGGTEHRA
ncbi:sugar ABC transporter ATP-binding protein [Paenibacillus sp. p3-SID1389]|uniref:sugar ABC transporter ATP-binding protein n=1 Tax=Paenibacillus sp. p3-SID1389 TaxID=2916364 RepID=UPI0021A28668|nr:sugar ABC transporter ATP-binding protein [Paenibacillus sp. p3-SID1389]MCT2197551.1 sugar ABC transporter ATP-binding protein [Paenibacillus sp. p3-SID1389]